MEGGEGEGGVGWWREGGRGVITTEHVYCTVQTSLHLHYYRLATCVEWLAR